MSTHNSKIPEDELMMLKTICQKIFDKKGFNILTLDVRGVSTIADYFIIAEGNIERHVQALASHIAEELSIHGRRPYHTEGAAVGDWIALDYGDLIIHLFTSEMREKYTLEQVWKEGKVVDIELDMERK